jgi:hypothetical protein
LPQISLVDVKVSVLQCWDQNVKKNLRKALFRVKLWPKNNYVSYGLDKKRGILVIRLNQIL